MQIAAFLNLKETFLDHPACNYDGSPKQESQLM